MTVRRRHPVVASAAAVLLAAALLAVILWWRQSGPGSPTGTDETGSSAKSGGADSAGPASDGSGSTAGAGSDRVVFTASADFSAGPAARRVFEQIAGLDPDLHLALGDFSYGETDTEQQWCNMVTASVGATFPFQLLAGNHESNGRDGDIDEFVQCLPNRLPSLEGVYGRQWYADVPQDDPLVRFILISPGMEFGREVPVTEEGILDFGEKSWSYNSGMARYAWTENAIDEARAASIPWVVVGMHAPCISVGEYGCDSGTDISTLLMQKEVDLVLHGHEHLYQRTHQLALAQGCRTLEPGRFSADCIANKGSEFPKQAGTVFATVGTGGAPLREVHTRDPEAPYFAALSGSNRSPAHGSLQVTLTPGRLVAEFTAVAEADFTDFFTITAGR